MEAKILLKKIRDLQSESKISTKELAESIGFSPQNLYNIFNMKQHLTVETLLKISEKLNVDPVELFDGDVKNYAKESKEKYKTKHDADCIPRHDFEFLKQQIEVLNKIILNSLHGNDDNKPMQASLQ